MHIKLFFYSDFYPGVVIYVSAKIKILPWLSPTDQRNTRLTGNVTSTSSITVAGLFVSLGSCPGYIQTIPHLYSKVFGIGSSSPVTLRAG